ncbi:MAG: OsmC family protein [Planctomycetota bacterium]
MSETPSPDAVCDGGDLDCGSGLLLIIREAMQPLAPGGLLEVRSRESSVAVDLPAWCRLVGHDLIEATPFVTSGPQPGASYFVRKKLAEDEALAADLERARAHVWTVRARAREGMGARLFARNHAFDVGQPASFDTADAAPSAVEYLLGALAGCLAVGMRWRAVRRGIEVFELEVSLRARLDDPLVFLGLSSAGRSGLAGVEGRLFIDAVADDDVLDELWRETLQRSPVAATLEGHVPLTIERRSH